MNYDPAGHSTVVTVDSNAGACNIRRGLMAALTHMTVYFLCCAHRIGLVHVRNINIRAMWLDLHNTRA